MLVITDTAYVNCIKWNVMNLISVPGALDICEVFFSCELLCYPSIMLTDTEILLKVSPESITTTHQISRMLEPLLNSRI